MTKFPMTAYEAIQAVLNQTYHSRIIKITHAFGFREDHSDGLVKMVESALNDGRIRIAGVVKDADAVAYRFGFDRDLSGGVSYSFEPILEGVKISLSYMSASCWCHFHDRVFEMVNEICAKHSGKQFELVCVSPNDRTISNVCIILVERK